MKSPVNLYYLSVVNTQSEITQLQTFDLDSNKLTKLWPAYSDGPYKWKSESGK